MANTTNFNWETPDDTDLVKDGAAAIRTLGSAIDTSLVDLKGGTTGQVLSKATNTDMDFTWVAQDDSNAIQNAIIDAKGDLIVGTAADTPARLAVGTNGYVLTADSAETAGVKWAAAAGGGKVLQVVSATNTTQVTITSNTTYADTGITATITPTASNSKILILVMGATSVSRNVSNTIFGFSMKLLRGATSLFENTNQGIEMATVTDKGMKFYLHYSYLDSPATTSATTYKIQSKSEYDNSSVYWQDSSGGNTRLSSIILMEIGA